MSNPDQSDKPTKNGLPNITRTQLLEVLTEDEIKFLKELREKFDSRVLYGTLLKPQENQNDENARSKRQTTPQGHTVA